VTTRHGIHDGWRDLPDERRAAILEWIATFAEGQLVVEVEVEDDGSVVVVAQQIGDNGKPVYDRDARGAATYRTRYVPELPPPDEWYA